jgi:hypothetical protein
VTTDAPPLLVAEFDALALHWHIDVQFRPYGAFGTLARLDGTGEPLKCHGDGLVELMRDALRVASLPK